LLQVEATMLDAKIVMQFVGLQFGNGRTVTLMNLVAVLPHASEALIWTVVLELSGKQVFVGGLKVSTRLEQH
jgi:hypothetical protein